MMKKCPYCAESIEDGIVVCPFCGRDVSGSVHPSAVESPQLLPSFNMGMALLVVAGGFTLASILVVLSNIICLFYPFGGLVAGLTVVGVLSRARPSTRVLSTRLPIIAGWMLGWFLTAVVGLFISYMISDSIGAYISDAVEMLAISTVMGVFVGKHVPGGGLKIFWFWMLAYLANIVIFLAFDLLGARQSDASLLLSVFIIMIGNVTMGIIGSYLTLRELRNHN